MSDCSPMRQLDHMCGSRQPLLTIEQQLPNPFLMCLWVVAMGIFSQLAGVGALWLLWTLPLQLCLPVCLSQHWV